MKKPVWIAAICICVVGYVPVRLCVRAWVSTAHTRMDIPFDAADWRARTTNRLAMVHDLNRRLDSREIATDKASILETLGEARYRSDWNCYYWVAGVTFSDSLNVFDLSCTYLCAYFDTNDNVRKLELKSWPM